MPGMSSRQLHLVGSQGLCSYSRCSKLAPDTRFDYPGPLVSPSSTPKHILPDSLINSMTGCNPHFVTVHNGSIKHVVQLVVIPLDIFRWQSDIFHCPIYDWINVHHVIGHHGRPGSIFVSLLGSARYGSEAVKAFVERMPTMGAVFSRRQTIY